MTDQPQTLVEDIQRLIDDNRRLQTSVAALRMNVKKMHEKLDETRKENERLRRNLEKAQGNEPVYEPVTYGCNESGVAMYYSYNGQGRIVYGNDITHTEITLPAGWHVCKKRED